jgi:CRP/FNR family cyclic AMP-dependent transcriptional regulator
MGNMPVLNFTTLGEIPLFRNLTPAQLAHLKQLLHYKTFPAGMNLITIEQQGEVAFILLSGTVKIEFVEDEDHEIILAILGVGEIVGEMSLVDSLGRSANVVTMEETAVFWLDRAAFWDCLQAMPTMTYNLVSIISRRLRLANTQIRSFATLDVYGRVARQLLAFAHEYGEAQSNGDVFIPLRLTQREFAGLIGATRVHVNRVLAAYKQSKYISVDANYRITIHNAGALAQRAR